MWQELKDRLIIFAFLISVYGSCAVCLHLLYLKFLSAFV